MNKKATKLSTSKKCVFSAITCVGMFLALECMLFFAGVTPETTKHDPWVGFDGATPLWTSADGKMMTTSPVKRRYFNQQSFTAIKPANTIRVVCVGGSTTYGRPFDDSTSYSAYLRELLPIVDPSHAWEVINAGGISYASYRVAAVMEETAKYQPDVFVVFSAHNEFLERRTYAGIFDTPPWRRRIDIALRSTRTVSAAVSLIDRLRTPPVPADLLPGEVDERLNHTVGPSDYNRDDAWQAAVVAHYRLNLDRMIAIANDCSAKMVLVMPASNEKDCAPFKIDGHDHYADGLHQFLMNDFAAAERSFQAAIDDDVCPLRATTSIDRTVRDVAQHQSVPIVEFKTRLKDLCEARLGHRCLGDELFLDHVHPTVDVHRDLAVWIIDQMIASKIVGGHRPSPEQIGVTGKKIHDAINANDQAVAFRNLAKVTHWAGKFDEAVRHGQDALRLLPDDPESQFVIADSLVRLGRPDEAIAAFERLLRTVEYERAFLPYAFLLYDMNRFDDAEAYALMATASENASTRERAMELLSGIESR